MTRITKLYEKLLSGRPLSFAELERLLHAFGFVFDRTNGSHSIFRRAGIDARVNIQPKGKHAKRYQKQQILDIIEKYGLTMEE